MEETEREYRQIIELLKRENRLRNLPTDRSEDGRIIDLCSNDYMGMAQISERWREDFMSAHRSTPFTSSASRLLAKREKEYYDFEAYLEQEYGKSALLYNSGYHANVGVASVLSEGNTLWATDKLVHASAIDGIRLGGGEQKRWRHNDVSHLRKILEAEHERRDRIIVMCESVYSMDGDIAPLRELVRLKEEYSKMMLYVDEAHAIGVFGPHGLGRSVEEGILDRVDILVGTLGKAVGSMGAYVITTPLLKEYLINTSRSLIFSTAIPPINVAWSMEMMRHLAEMDAERSHLAKIAERFRRGIERITGESNPSRSAIIPLMTGDALRAIEISRQLEQEGILALPIRRPTVPPGGERIRFSLNATLSEEDIDNILTRISKAYER